MQRWRESQPQNEGRTTGNSLETTEMGESRAVEEGGKKRGGQHAPTHAPPMKTHCRSTTLEVCEGRETKKRADKTKEGRGVQVRVKARGAPAPPPPPHPFTIPHSPAKGHEVDTHLRLLQSRRRVERRWGGCATREVKGAHPAHRTALLSCQQRTGGKKVEETLKLTAHVPQCASTHTHTHPHSRTHTRNKEDHQKKSTGRASREIRNGERGVKPMQRTARPPLQRRV